MAQEKISFNAALMSLPLQADPTRLARCDCRDDRQSWDLDGRVLAEFPQRWQPGFFFIRKADTDSAKFSLKVYNATTRALVKTLASAQLSGVGIYRQTPSVPGAQSWDTVIVPARNNLSVDLPAGVYYLTVAGLTSEPFRVIAYDNGDLVPPVDHLQFTLSNAHMLAQVPYQTGYSQTLGLPGNLCVGEVKTYTEADKSDRFGTRITFNRQYRVWTLDYAEVGEPLAGLLKSLESHDQVLIQDNHKTLTLKGSDISVTLKEDSCCTLSASLIFNEVLSEWESCDNNLPLVAQTGLLSAPVGYSDPADSDPTPSPYVPPVSTVSPTPAATNPVAGTILNQSTLTHDCANPFLYNGVNYQIKRIITKADGNGGSIDEVTYEGICSVNPILVPVPTLPGLFGPLRLRVGQPVNIRLVPDGLFGPAPGQSAQPVVSVTGLPTGTSYSGGRVVGNPTTTGDTTATVTITQPGGATVSAPYVISTVAAAPTFADASLNVTYQYNPSNQTLAVTIISPVQPQIKAVGLQVSDYDFVSATATGGLDSWNLSIPAVLQSGILRIRQIGSTGTGLSFPVTINQNTGSSSGSSAVPNVHQVAGVSSDAQLKTFLFNELTLAKGDTALTNLLCSIVAACSGGTGGSTTGGTLSWSADSLIALKNWLEQAFAYDLGWLDPATQQPLSTPPAPPTNLGGSVVVTPAVSATNQSRYEPTDYTIVVDSHVIGTDRVSCRLRGSSGSVSPDTTWHDTGLYDGTITSGSRSFTYTSYIPDGNYIVDLRINGDETNLISKTITVTGSKPKPVAGQISITGKLNPLETEQGVIYTLNQGYNDGSTQTITLANPYDWGFTPQISGIGIINGVFSGNTNATSITKDTFLTITAPYLGVIYKLPITLLNVDPATNQPTTPTEPLIYDPKSQSNDQVGWVSLANIKASITAQNRRRFYLITNAVQATSSTYDLDWEDAVPIDTQGTRSTARVLWGFRLPGPGTYAVYELWRQKNEADSSKWVSLAMYRMTVPGASNNGTVGQWEADPAYQMPPSNTLVRIQHQFIPNGYGTAGQGSGDYLQFKQLDGFDDEPMYIAVQLSSQAAPTSFSANFSRATNGQNGSSQPKNALRSFALASGQNLKNKTFTAYISRNLNGTNYLHSFSFSTGSTATDGFVTDYQSS